MQVDRLAYELGWTLERLLAALDSLKSQLAHVGQELGWVGDSRVAIAHRFDDATNDVAAALVREDIAEAGLTIADARLLLAACHGQERTSRANALPIVNVRKLEMAGLITTESEGTWERGSGIRLTDAATRALGV